MKLLTLALGLLTATTLATPTADAAAALEKRAGTHGKVIPPCSCGAGVQFNEDCDATRGSPCTASCTNGNHWYGSCLGTKCVNQKRGTPCEAKARPPPQPEDSGES